MVLATGTYMDFKTAADFLLGAQTSKTYICDSGVLVKDSAFAGGAVYGLDLGWWFRSEDPVLDKFASQSFFLTWAAMGGGQGFSAVHPHCLEPHLVLLWATAAKLGCLTRNSDL